MSAVNKSNPPISTEATTGGSIVASKILCVDDEPAVLRSLKRLLLHSGFDVTVATSGQKGLELQADTEFEVVISDMKMPEMDGATFLSLTAKKLPDCGRILLTGYSEQTDTVRAVNKGKIDFYLNKPWSNNELIEVVTSCVKIKRERGKLKKNAIQLASNNRKLKGYSKNLQQAKKNLESELAQSQSFLDLAHDQLQLTYMNTIKVFANMINGRLGLSVDYQQSVLSYVMQLGNHLKLDKNMMHDLEIASQLHALGKVVLSDNILNSPASELDSEQKIQHQQFPQLGAEILIPLDAMQNVSKMVAHQNDLYQEGELSEESATDEIPVGARILGLVVYYANLRHGIESENTFTREEALSLIRHQSGARFDPQLVDIFSQAVEDEEEIDCLSTDEHVINIKELEEGQLISRDIYDENSLLLLAKNTTINKTHIFNLIKFEHSRGQTVLIYIKTNNV